MENFDYFNTWQTQNILGYLNKISNRDAIDENFLFGKNGLCYIYPKIRKDLYFILDDGWDMNYNKNVNEDYPFASHIIKDDRFPSFQGTPQEKLKQIVTKIKDIGWKGVGIWVCAQGYKEAYFYDLKKLKNHFKERLLWSKYANVSYWKVDWGKFDNEIAFRKMLTNLAKKIYPELIIENAYCTSPVNGYKNVEKGKEYIFPYESKMENFLKKVVPISKVFRSYDVTEELSIITTIERLSYLLKYKTYINVEDEPYIGAIMGCPIGIQRNILISKNLPKLIKERSHYKVKEIDATINYKNINPSFTNRKLHKSKKLLAATYKFNEYWCDECNNATITQLAPAIMSLNSSLPKVINLKNEEPFVLASLNNNNYAIGAFKRLNYEKQNKYKVDIKIKLNNSINTIAIFNDIINNLEISFNETIKANKFILVNLFTLKEKDITNLIKISDNKLIIPCKNIKINKPKNDASYKAILIKIV